MSSKLEHNCVTEFSSYSYTYEWKISNVNCRLDKSEPLQCPETIKSPPGKIPATEWQLQALGYKAISGSSTSQNQQPNSWTVRLTLFSPSPVWVRVQLSTKGRVNPFSGSSEKYSTRTLTVSPQCPAPHSVRIWPRSNPNYFTGYIPITKYGDRESIDQDYLYGQDLILCCDVTVTHLESPVHATRSVAEVEIDLPSFDLSMVMEDARQRDRYTDVTIVTKEKEFKAHKVVLACQSIFFETCLEDRWKKGDSNRIEMLDVPIDIMDAVLTYMYTGKVKDIDQAAYDLLPKANEYQLEGLKMKCEEALIKALTSQTVIDILLMADMHNAQKLRESCMLFIAKNITDVKKSSAWMEENLKTTNKDLLMEVLEHIVNLL